MSICLSRIRDTRIENDSDNSTSYKYLLVRNVFLGIHPLKHEAPCGNELRTPARGQVPVIRYPPFAKSLAPPPPPRSLGASRPQPRGRSIFDRLLPKGRKKTPRCFQVLDKVLKGNICKFQLFVLSLPRKYDDYE